MAISFASLDDFHPDGLAARLPLFQRLRSLRTQSPSRRRETPVRALPRNPRVSRVS